MAKEQVELALSDFQTEFFEGKYVQRTNDGTKKEYISKKLQAGVETTNFYAQASTEGNVIVYEGKNNSGTEVVKGTIQDDASIKWDDVKIGNVGENGSGGEEESGGSNGSGNASSEELAQLKAGMEQLQGEVSNLKNKLEASQKELTSTKDILDSILTSQTRKDVLYEGSADKIGTYSFTFPEGKSLESYKMLIFFVDGYFPAYNMWLAKRTVMIEPVAEDKQFGYDVFWNQGPATSDNWWSFYFSIPTTNQFRVDALDMGARYTSVRIYKVIGIY